MAGPPTDPVRERALEHATRLRTSLREHAADLAWVEPGAVQGAAALSSAIDAARRVIDCLEAEPPHNEPTGASE